MIKITGAGGFVGQNLTRYLKKSNLNSKMISRSDLQNISADLLSGTECVVHLAGKAHDLKRTSDPQEYYKVNFDITRELYDAFIQSDASKFIFVSSVKASADTVSNILTEEDVANPMTDYGKSKLMAEQYIQGHNCPPGKSFYILRPCIIHGPDHKGNLNLLLRFVKSGIPYPLASFKNKRSFLSVENLCFVIKELATHNIPSGVYHIADDEALSTNEVIVLLAKSIGVDPKLWPISKYLINKLAKIGDILKLPLNTERLKKLTDNYVVSNRKITNALNVELPVKSREGLIQTAKSFK